MKHRETGGTRGSTGTPDPGNGRGSDEPHRGTGRSTRLFFWWADHPAAQVAVLLLFSTLAVIGYLKPSLVLDLFASEVEAVDESKPTPARRRGSLETDSSAAQAANVEPFRVGGVILICRITPSTISSCRC